MELLRARKAVRAGAGGFSGSESESLKERKLLNMSIMDRLASRLVIHRMHRRTRLNSAACRKYRLSCSSARTAQVDISSSVMAVVERSCGNVVMSCVVSQ